jgi:hypothetical protein
MIPEENASNALCAIHTQNDWPPVDMCAWSMIQAKNMVNIYKMLKESGWKI